MPGSRNCRQGGPGQSDNVFIIIIILVLSLFYRSQMVNFKEIYHFQGSRGGPTFSRGGGVQLLPGEGVQLLIFYRNPYNL